MPPSRWKVVEQGRRLVVIDTWNGDAPVRRTPPVEARRPASLEEAPTALRSGPQTGSPGMEVPALILATRRWYDDKAPRRIRVEGAGQSKLVLLLAGALIVLALLFAAFGWTGLLVLGFVLLQPKARNGMRPLVTRFLDSLERA